jgi:DNA-binding NarL/FixJ family response regulator
MKKTVKILITDDHHLVRQGLKLILKNQDELVFEVLEVDSGEKAIKMFQTEKIDIALMDISMEGMNGIDATKAILSENSFAKIIALSMHSETYLIRKMIDAGAVGFVLKDTESDELLRAIKTVLKGQNYYTNEVSLKLMGHFKEKVREEYNEDLAISFKISKREIEILDLIAKQLTNEEIADKLEISKRTVDSHRQKILAKLGLKNTAGLIHYAMKNHLIS